MKEFARTFATVVVRFALPVVAFVVVTLWSNDLRIGAMASLLLFASTTVASAALDARASSRDSANPPRLLSATGGTVPAAFSAAGPGRTTPSGAPRGPAWWCARRRRRRRLRPSRWGRSRTCPRGRREPGPLCTLLLGGLGLAWC